MVKLIRFLFVCAVILAIAGCGWSASRSGISAAICLITSARPLSAADHDARLCRRRAAVGRIREPSGDLRADPGDPKAASSMRSCPPKTRISTPITASIRCRSLRAAITDIGRLRANRRPIGASTNHPAGRQEHAARQRVVSLPARSRKSCWRLRIEAAMPKDRILELYLNEIYLGRAPMASPPRRSAISTSRSTS